MENALFWVRGNPETRAHIQLGQHLETAVTFPQVTSPRKVLVAMLRTASLSQLKTHTLHLRNVYMKSFVEIGRYVDGESLNIEVEVLCD